MKIVFSNIFLFEVGQIIKYLTKNSTEEIAKNFTKKLDEMSKVLLENPEIGSNKYSYIFTESKVKTYLIHNFKYLVFYRLTKNCIHVERVLHTSRDIPTILQIQN
jgi:plasmid stabilization system protein ParE